VPSTLTACCSAGSVEELVADMLMHRAAMGVRRMAAADVREEILQGEAAGRNMAVPVNWRVLAMGTCSCEARSSDDARLASALPGKTR
jgi:L-fucose isomerase-like protein